MLMEVGFPSYFGYNAPQNNAADMNTKGWDLELSWSDQINDFRYGVSFNLSDYRSKMGYMANRQKIDDNKITEEGSYFNEWYGYKSMGIILNDAAMLDENGNTIPVLTNNDKAGNIRYQDIDGDAKSLLPPIVYAWAIPYQKCNTVALYGQNGKAWISIYHFKVLDIN